MIRVILPPTSEPWRTSGSEVTLEVEGPATQRSVLDALEARYPMLRGAIRDHDTQQRRPFLRFFACEEDLSHEPPDAPLPDAVTSGKEPFICDRGHCWRVVRNMLGIAEIRVRASASAVPSEMQK